MKVEIDKAKLINGEIINDNTLLIIENVKHIRITKNNRYIAIDPKENHGFNCLLIDMLKFNISIIE